MLKQYIAKIVEKENLTQVEAEEAMKVIMEGNATQAQIGGFLLAEKMKGETIEEIAGFAQAMRNKAERINPNVEYSIDTCGTGGDCAHTINISTAAAFIVSAAEIPVAKHGNRSVSSRCGSADVLEALGCKIDLIPEKVKVCIEQIGLGFMFAPIFHSSMKFAGGPRKELGVRTVFNILGPITNPANAPSQLLGVFRKDLAEIMAKVLQKLGTDRAVIIHGSDGLDEITINGPTFVTELSNGIISEYQLSPEQFGIESRSLSEIRGGDKEENAEIIKGVLQGDLKGAKRDVIILNSAGALYAGKKVNTIAEGVTLATEMIDSGAAVKKMKEFVEFTNSI